MAVTYTYDSGGAGSLPDGGDPDYSSLNTWEADTDIDLTSIGISTLECYDSQVHVETPVWMDGDSGTDSTHYRCIKSADGCVIPFNGAASTGANFTIDCGAESKGITTTGNYSRIVNIVITTTHNINVTCKSMYIGGRECKAIGCVAYNCQNAHATYMAAGFYCRGYVSGPSLIYNCIAYGCEIGFSASDVTGVFVCCTAIDNDYGFAGSTATVFSCYAADNSGGDFYGSWASGSAWNASKDNTANLGGIAGDNYKNSVDYTGNMDANYLLTASCSANGAAGDRCGRNPYDDFTTSLSDYHDFFKNDAEGEALSKRDIIGNERSNPGVADSVWDVGASQYAAGWIICGIKPAKIDGISTANINKINGSTS